MELISILYIIGALTAIAASVPQIIRLLQTKRSDELSLQTWVIWTGTQITSLIYVISLGNILMTITNIAWVSFYAVMAFLIYRYRQPAETRQKLTTATAPESL